MELFFDWFSTVNPKNLSGFSHLPSFYPLNFCYQLISITQQAGNCIRCSEDRPVLSHRRRIELTSLRYFFSKVGNRAIVLSIGDIGSSGGSP